MIDLDALADAVISDLKSAKPPPDPIAWIQENFYLYDTAELMTLFEWQIRPLEQAFKRDSDDNYLYSTILWSWPKKSAKSSVIAAVVDYTAEHTPRASIKLIANDLRQADSRVGMYIRENIRIAQRKGQRQDIKITPSGYKIEYPNGAKIEMIPIDPSGEAGGNDDLIVYSELWGWNHIAHQRMWSEMTLSPTRYGRSQRWIDTYAGYTGSSAVLEGLYQTGVKQGRQLWDDLEIYENRAAKMLAVWVTKPLFPWQTPAYYAEQAATLTPPEYARMHGNEWVSPQNSFIPIEWWDACEGDLPPLNKYRTVVISLDAGIVSDSFAVVAVERQGDMIYVRYNQEWKPPPGGVVNFDEPEAEIRRLCKEYNVVCIVYDPHQLHFFCTRLSAELRVWFEPFPQGEQRLIADKQLYDNIREKLIMHGGEPILRQHIANASAKTDGDKMRIVKRSEALKIDLTVALSQANFQARFLNL